MNFSNLHLILCFIAWYKDENYIPTPQELSKVYDVPDKESPDYAKACRLLLWYSDKWLHAVAGDVNWNKITRCWKLPIWMCTHYGNTHVIVTSQTEAFGLFLLENCYAKWQLVIPKMVELGTPTKMPPYDKDDPSTHAYESKKVNALTKFSDSKAGQGKGWSEDAITALNAHIKTVKDSRQQQGQDEFPGMQLAKTLLRKEHKVSGSCINGKGSKKYKRALTMEEVLVGGGTSAKKKVKQDTSDDFNYGQEPAARGPNPSRAARPPPGFGEDHQTGTF